MPRLILKVSRTELSRMTLRRWSSSLPQILTRPKTGPENHSIFNVTVFGSHPWKAWQPKEEAMLVVHKADRCYTTARNDWKSWTQYQMSWEPVAMVGAMRQKMWGGHLEGKNLNTFSFAPKPERKTMKMAKKTDLYRQQSSRPPSPGLRSRRGS